MVWGTIRASARLMMVAMVVSMSLAHMGCERQASAKVGDDDLHRIVATCPDDRFDPESLEVGDGSGPDPAHDDSCHPLAGKNRGDDAASPVAGNVNGIALHDLARLFIDVHDLEFPGLSEMLIETPGPGHWHRYSHDGSTPVGKPHVYQTEAAAKEVAVVQFSSDCD
jgi:hypothetical protein